MLIEQNVTVTKKVNDWAFQGKMSFNPYRSKQFSQVRQTNSALIFIKSNLRQPNSQNDIGVYS